MSAQGLETLDHTVQLTHKWINELDGQLDWKDRARSYRLLKAVLHALRDTLQVNEAVDLGAQLPVLLRGAYYEQWRPAATPVKDRSIEGFLARVNESFRRDPLASAPAAVMAVFQLLAKKISEGEMEDVRRSLPEQVRSIWPGSGKPPRGVRH
jgi:uncharacterized protein (DUF2267 family)